MDFEKMIISHSENEPEWLVNKRLGSLKKYIQVPYPDFRYGLNVTLDTSGLELDKIDPLKTQKNKIRVENGAEISMTLGEAFDKPEVKKYLLRSADNDKFEHFHSMFWNQGILIHVPEGVEVEKPVRIDADMRSPSQFNQILVIAEPRSKLSILQTVSSGKVKGFRSEAVEIFVKEGAQVNYGSIQNLSRGVFNFSTKRAAAEKDSSVNWVDCTLGSRLSRAEVSTSLDGEGASTRNWGMFFGSEYQQFDLSSSTIHNAERTNCDMLTKGTLDGKAKAIYRGLVRINQNASGSNGYQKEETLLLSKDAEADPIPNLEIENNDVKCSHGASVGRIDADKMFYLMSRGVSEDSAKKMLVEGFFNPMIREIKIEKIRNELETHISSRMSKSLGGV